MTTKNTKHTEAIPCVFVLCQNSAARVNTNERLICYNIRMSNEMFERNLPPYLAYDLEAWKKGVEEKL